MDSSARSVPLRGTSLRILLRSSLLSVEKPCPLSRPRTSSSTPFALGNIRNPCPLRPQTGLSPTAPRLGKKRNRNHSNLGRATADRPFPERPTLFTSPDWSREVGGINGLISESYGRLGKRVMPKRLLLFGLLSLTSRPLSPT